MCGFAATVLSGVCGAFGLFGSGALGSFLTGQPMLRAGLRQVTVGLAASAVMYGLGRLAGIGLSGPTLRGGARLPQWVSPRSSHSGRLVA